MMSVNGTLFVQMLHFSVAYWALKQFLFAPVVRVILHEQEVADKLQVSIQELQESLESNERALLEQWMECREYLLLKNIEQADDVRTIAKKEFSIHGPAAHEVAFSRDEILDSAQSLAVKIVQKDRA